MASDLRFLQSLIERCDIHASRMNTAFEEVFPLMPLKPESIASLNSEQLNSMEMLLSRFGKLQDTLGTKLFLLLLPKLQQQDDNMSLLDILHRMEQLDLLPSTKWWLGLRNLRKYVTHEYPENPFLMASNINQAVIGARELFSYWENVRKKIIKIQDQWQQESSNKTLL